MQFSERTMREAWRLAQGRCECQREGHGHAGRCNLELRWDRRGFLGEGGWQADRWDGDDAPENYEVLCMACYEAAHRRG